MENSNSPYVPYIGANGNWYINNEDSGVKAQGRPGTQGPIGPQGLMGSTGETGYRGPQGIQGAIGAQGDKGDKGDKGDTGPQGAKGDTPELAVNLSTGDTGKALDATMGKILDDKVMEVNNKFIWKRIFWGTATAEVDYPFESNILNFSEIAVITASGNRFNSGNALMLDFVGTSDLTFCLPVGDGYVKLLLYKSGDTFMVKENTSSHAVRRIYIR